MSRTKIICTIGPSSKNKTILKNMMSAGMDVARLNFSHGSHQSHQYILDNINELYKRYQYQVKVLQDLEGYRIRIGKLENIKGIELNKGQEISITNQAILGNDKIIPIDYKYPLSDIKTGTHLYIDDGNISLKVLDSTIDHLMLEVVIPGILKEKKGVNIPDIELRFKGLTQKDKIDIQFGIKNKVDYIAQSFVRNKDDILQICDVVKPQLPSCQIVAKIENRQGINNIDEILDVADGIMIARGDMGVSIPIYEIPIVQKEIIRKCNRAKKFVITATQMLESMVENLRPTRAEVTDVANAVLDGSDFVMLSAETATGKYPVETVKMMEDVIKFTEQYKSNI